MMTPEGRVKAKVKRMLLSYACYQFWPVQSGMGEPALDCLGCHNGKFFSIECKAPGKKPTKRQTGTYNEICEAKGAAFVVDGSEISYEILKFWLEVTT